MKYMENIMITSELLKLKSQNELISLDRDCHDEELTGIICEVTDSVITMHLYTNDAEYDGYTIFETEQISSIYWGNREHKAIANLISKNKNPETPALKNIVFQDIIIELNNSYNSICFHEHGDEDKFDIAEIDKHDDSWLKLHTYGIKRSLSRMHKLISRDSISRIVVNSPYQNNIVSLHHEKL